MKVFITLLISCTTLISVEADLISDHKALIEEKTAAYKNMNELEIKALVTLTIKDSVAMLREASRLYRIFEISIEADNYDRIETSVMRTLPKIWITLDKEKIEERMNNLVKLGVITEMIKFRIKVEMGKRISNLTFTNDTEAILKDKFHQTVNETLTVLKRAVDYLTERKYIFWTDIHQKLYEYISSMFEGLEERMKMLKSDAIRAKNYQIMINDLLVTLAVSDTRSFNEKQTDQSTTQINQIHSTT